MPDTTIRMRVGILKASQCIGYQVENAQGESLGKIEDLMIDVNEGYVAAAILAFGGFLGMGEKRVAVPLSALALHPRDRKFTLNVDRETLRNAPSFDQDTWPHATDRTWAADIYSYYGYPPYWE